MRAEFGFFIFATAILVGIAALAVSSARHREELARQCADRGGELVRVKWGYRCFSPDAFK